MKFSSSIWGRGKRLKSRYGYPEHRRLCDAILKTNLLVDASLAHY